MPQSGTRVVNRAQWPMGGEYIARIGGCTRLKFGQGAIVVISIGYPVFGHCCFFFPCGRDVLWPLWEHPQVGSLDFLGFWLSEVMSEFCEGRRGRYVEGHGITPSKSHDVCH